MWMQGNDLTSKTIYHDGKDWLIAKWGEFYWSYPFDGEEWEQGLPAGLTNEDVLSILPQRRRLYGH